MGADFPRSNFPTKDQKKKRKEKNRINKYEKNKRKSVFCLKIKSKILLS